MTTYQTAIYKVIYDNEWGWDYNGETLFESKIYESPTDAMLEYSFAEPSHPNWFGIMKTIIDGVVVEYELFEASVYEINEFGDLV